MSVDEFFKMPSEAAKIYIKNNGFNAFFEEDVDFLSRFLTYGWVTDRHEKLEILIDHGIDTNKLNEEYPDGYTPLATLIMDCDVESSDALSLVEHCLSLGIDVNAASVDGILPIHISAWKNNFELTNLLLKYGAKPNSKTEHGDSPLILLLSESQSRWRRSIEYKPFYMGIIYDVSDKINHIELLLKNKADIFYYNKKEYRDCLGYIFEYEEYDILKYLLSKGFLSSNDYLYKGSEEILFHRVIRTDNIEIVKLILDYQSDINFRDKIKESAIFKTTNVKIAQFLHDNGSDITYLNNEGEPFFIKDYGFRTDIFYKFAAEFVKLGGDINARSREGCSALHLIVNDLFATNRNEAIRLAISLGCDLNGQNKNGHTPLTLAISKIKNRDDVVRQIDVVKELLSAGADPNLAIDQVEGRNTSRVIVTSSLGQISTKCKATPLILAVVQGQVDVVQELLNAGADPNLADGHGRTPLMYANKVSIAKDLLKYGADIQQKDKRGKSATGHVKGKALSLLLQKGAKIKNVNKNQFLQSIQSNNIKLFLDLLNRSNGFKCKSDLFLDKISFFETCCRSNYHLFKDKFYLENQNNLSSLDKRASRNLTKLLETCDSDKQIRRVATGDDGVFAPLLQNISWPKKSPPKLPDYFFVSAHPPPILKNSGEALPSQIIETLASMMLASDCRAQVPGMQDIIEACSAQSLADFALSVFEVWFKNGSKIGGRGFLYALAYIGDDRAAAMLSKIYRSASPAAATPVLDVLASMGTNTAIAGLQAIAHLSPKAVSRELAGKVLEDVARDRGLTPDILEDLAVPDLGLDSSSRTSLDFGSREFLVTLDANLDAVLTDELGNVLKTLPKAIKTDNASKATAATAQWKEFKAALKGQANDQKKRFEQAMLLRREWDGATFMKIVVKHPLLATMVRSLVWAIAKGGVCDTAFRIDADGRCIALDGTEFSLDDEVRVTLPHPVVMGEKVEPWLQIFAENKITQPFPQLARKWFIQGPSTEKLIRDRDATKVPLGSLRGLKAKGWRFNEDGAGMFTGVYKFMDGAHASIDVEPGRSPSGVQMIKLEVSGTDPIAYSELVRDALAIPIVES